MAIAGGAPGPSCNMDGGTGKSCRSGLRAASGVRSGTRRRRGSLGRSDVVVGCPAVGFQIYAFSANLSQRLRHARRLPAPSLCTCARKSACICLQLRARGTTFFDTSVHAFLLHSLSLVAGVSAFKYGLPIVATHVLCFIRPIPNQCSTRKRNVLAPVTYLQRIQHEYLW